MSRSKNKSPRNRDESKPARSANSLPGRLVAWFRAKNPVLRFVAVFFVLGSVFYLAMLSPLCRYRILPGYLRLTAQLASPVCNWFGQHTRALGAEVTSDRFSIEIARGCDASEPLALFAAAVLAFPAPFRRKIPALVIGTAILAVMNQVRIVSLFLVGVYFPSAFEMMHLEVWQTLFILVVIVLWALWIQWATKEEVRSVSR